MDPAKIITILWSLAAFPAGAQQLPITIACGSATDQYFVGTSYAYSDAKLPVIYPALRFGPTVHYRIPVQPGVYVGFLDFVEPNKTAAGQRLMSVQIDNGASSLPIDLFASAPGDDVVFRVPFISVAQVGVVDILITGVSGNAVLSGIEIAGAPLTTGLLPGHLEPGGWGHPEPTLLYGDGKNIKMQLGVLALAIP